MASEHRQLSSDHQAHDDWHGVIIGASDRFADCLRTMLEAAATDSSVLLCGETGTGKELFARAIHQHSARAGGAFVAVDCTALPETIVGSLLFGHEQGSFTGASVTTDGMIRQAHRGTLFLDEVGDLSPGLQKVFLRVLDDHRFRPLGSSREVESDFRLVAATNRDLQRSVNQGRFRQDLLYRLEAYAIELPPLRYRTGDIQALAEYHLDRICRRYGITTKRLTPECVQTLSLYPWPGNIRELINTLEQAVFMARQEMVLFPKHLPQHLRVRVARKALEAHRSNFRSPEVPVPQDLPCLQDFRADVFSQAEKCYLFNLVQHTGRDVARACRLAGLSRSRLYSLLKKHQIALH